MKNIVRDVDGYYYFWPTKNEGHYSSQHLREIANHLDELNKPYEESIDEYFRNNPPTDTDDELPF